MREQRLAVRHQKVEHAELRDLARERSEYGKQFVKRRLRGRESLTQTLQQRAEREFAVGGADRLIHAGQER